MGTVFHILPFVISPCYSMRVWITGLPRQKEGWEKDGRTDGRTDRFPLCSTGLRPLRGRCPAPPQPKSHTTQAGHGYRWPLTAFGLLLISNFFLGLQGVKGVRGLAGHSGLPGDYGVEGPRGPLGVRGEPGYIGAIGPKVSKMEIRHGNDYYISG